MNDAHLWTILQLSVQCPTFKHTVLTASTNVFLVSYVVEVALNKRQGGAHLGA